VASVAQAFHFRAEGKGHGGWEKWRDKGKNGETWASSRGHRMGRQMWKRHGHAMGHGNFSGLKAFRSNSGVIPKSRTTFLLLRFRSNSGVIPKSFRSNSEVKRSPRFRNYLGMTSELLRNYPRILWNYSGILWNYSGIL
jgi:hypothetical protein